jgi:hypothetical protein
MMETRRGEPVAGSRALAAGMIREGDGWGLTRTRATLRAKSA